MKGWDVCLRQQATHSLKKNKGSLELKRVYSEQIVTGWDVVGGCQGFALISRCTSWLIGVFYWLKQGRRESGTTRNIVPGPMMIKASLKSSRVSQPCFWRHTNRIHFWTFPNKTHLIQLNVLLETPRPDLDWSNKGDIQSVYYIDVPPGRGMETLLYGIAYLLDKGDVPNVVLGTMKLNYDPGSKSKVLRIFWSLDMA